MTQIDKMTHQQATEQLCCQSATVHVQTPLSSWATVTTRSFLTALIAALTEMLLMLSVLLSNVLLGCLWKADNKQTKPPELAWWSVLCRFYCAIFWKQQKESSASLDTDELCLRFPSHRWRQIMYSYYRLLLFAWIMTELWPTGTKSLLFACIVSICVAETWRRLGLIFG